MELQCESPVEQGILGSSSAITGRIPIPHRPQPGHVPLLQHGQRESRTLHIWQKGLTRRVCQTGKEAQGTVMWLEFAQQLLGHCQGYCWKLCRNELQGFAVVVLSWPHSCSHGASQPCSTNSLQGCFVLLPDPFSGKSPDYSNNCKTRLKMRMCSGVSENNNSKTLPTLLVYRVIIITGMTSWWVAHIDSLPGCGSADPGTSVINLSTRLTEYALELCSSYCKSCLWKRGAMMDKYLLISMFEEYLISQGLKKKQQ